MSYDFTKMSNEEFLEELGTVDDMRIWRIAEAIRRHIPYEEIHALTRIDVWFIDKIAVLVGMEYSLATQHLTVSLLKRGEKA